MLVALGYATAPLIAAGVAVLGEPLTTTIVAWFALILGGSVLATAPGPGGGAHLRIRLTRPGTG